MIHFTAALGMLVTAVVLKPLFVGLLLAFDMNANYELWLDMLLLKEFLLVAGLSIAWITTHLAQLNRRLPKPVPGRPALMLGVWGYIAVLAATLGHLLTYGVYVIEAFPSKYFLTSPFVSPAINTLLLYGIGRALLGSQVRVPA